jgi:hypothetical protein
MTQVGVDDTNAVYTPRQSERLQVLLGKTTVKRHPLTIGQLYYLADPPRS